MYLSISADEIDLAQIVNRKILKTLLWNSYLKGMTKHVGLFQYPGSEGGGGGVPTSSRML